MKNHHINRIVQLIRNDIQRVYKRTGIVAAAILPVLLLALYFPLSINLSIFPGDSFLQDAGFLKRHYDFFPLFLFLGGLLFTNLVLANLVPLPQRKVYLSLAAENWEKVMARWVLTGLLFPVVAVVFYWIAVLFSKWVIVRSLGLELVELSLFDGFLWRWVFWYIGLQPIFFLGAMSLGRFAAAKTILWGGFLLFSLLLIFNITILLLVPDISFGGSVWGWMLFDSIPVFSSLLPVELQSLNVQTPGLKLPDILVLLSPLFLFISFLKFTEKEIT